MTNDTPYGLATSIYTSDFNCANRVPAQIEVGLCWINSWFLRDLRTAFLCRCVAHSTRPREEQQRTRVQ
jgi:acyl-CoA reductase-like NAD-dependent aldehyde dehydrogenase